MKISVIYKLFREPLNSFVVGLVIGCSIMYVFYTAYFSYYIHNRDKFWIKTNSEYIKKYHRLI
jgi:hypothetical protein